MTNNSVYNVIALNEYYRKSAEEDRRDGEMKTISELGSNDMECPRKFRPKKKKYSRKKRLQIRKQKVMETVI